MARRPSVAGPSYPTPRVPPPLFDPVSGPRLWVDGADEVGIGGLKLLGPVEMLVGPLAVVVGRGVVGGIVGAGVYCGCV